MGTRMVQVPVWREYAATQGALHEPAPRALWHARGHFFTPVRAWNGECLVMPGFGLLFNKSFKKRAFIH